MTKFLLIYAASITLLLAGGAAWLRHTMTENGRLRRNQEALTSEIEHYVTSSGRSAATIHALELDLAEFRRMHADDVERIRELDIALRRVESSASAATATRLDIEAPLRDTTIERTDICADIATHLGQGPLLEEAESFQWSDDWCKVRGIIRDDIVECLVESVDTLHQIIHRVPRKFLCFRFGTKAIRQEIVSSNPHTKVVYSEYIELPRRRRRR